MRKICVVREKERGIGGWLKIMGFRNFTWIKKSFVFI